MEIVVFDDDHRNGRPTFPYGKPVNPDITLHWEVGNCLGLSRGNKALNNGTTINAKTATWPLDFTVIPQMPALSCKIYAKGQVDDFGEKAVDTIHGRIVNVDLDVETDGKPGITDGDEHKEENPGGYACVCTNNLTPINLTLQPAGLSGKVTLSTTDGGGRIRIWADAKRKTEVILPKTWNASATIPATLYVEGIAPSAAVRDVELRLEYDENPPGQNNPLFKCEDRVRLTWIKVDAIKFQKPTMVPSWKTVDQVYKHLGVFTGQSATFGVNTTPSGISLSNGLFTWGGLASGTTPEVFVTFSAPIFIDAVTVTSGGTKKSAFVAIRDRPSGMGEEAYALAHLPYTIIAIANNLVPNTYPPTVATLEPYVWASAAYPGIQHNTVADAARHAYWTCLLTRYTVAGYAEGLTTQHEVTSLGPSTETVMDLHNNLMGISIEGDHTHTSGLGCCRTAIQSAVSAGDLWYLDSSYGVANIAEDALLQPTNK